MARMLSAFCWLAGHSRGKLFRTMDIRFGYRGVLAKRRLTEPSSNGQTSKIVTRVTFVAAAWICSGAFLPLLQGQQTPAPVVPTAGSSQQTQPPVDIPLLPPANTTPPAAIDPKTGLPVLPEDQRQQEIDKFDPMKRNVNPAAQPSASPLTDRQQADQAVDADGKPKPQPGSDDASGTKTKSAAKSNTSGDSTDDSTDDTADTNGAEYSGPAVLSRSYTLSRPMVPAQIKWSASVGVSYSFNEGESPTVVGGVTTFVPATSSGGGMSWGFGGRHIWKRDQIGVTYSAGYSQFGIRSLGGGVSNSLGLDYSHVVSHRVTVHFVQSLSQLSQSYSLQNPNPTPATSVANINLAVSPSSGLLSNSSRGSSSAFSMTFRQTGRLSYNLSSSFFINGVTGGTGMYGNQFGADVNYRWTRNITIGGYYSYTEYHYSHNISTSDSNGVGAIFSYALDRYTQLRTSFGASRIESLGLEPVPLSPGLAALLGQGSTIINAYNLQWTSDISVELVRDLHRTRRATLAYAHGESPGNGVLLTSVQQSFSAGYSMSFFRKRLPLNANAGYSRLQGVSQGQVGFFHSESASVSTSRRVGPGITSSLSISYQRYDVSGTAVQAHDMSVSLSLGWGVPARWMRF